MKPTEKALALDDLELDPRCQTRVGLAHDTVAEYADLYRDGTKLPPLACFDVDGVPYLVDGFHRLAALRQADQSFARVRIVGRGALEEARWAALAANQTHGLRRTNADKRKAVLMALENGIGVEQSSRTIAEHVGVHHSTVSEIRKAWEAEQVAKTDTCDRAGDTSAPDTVTGRDGKRYQRKPRVQHEPTAGDPDQDAQGPEIPSERKPKKAAPSPFEVFRKSVQHVAADVPKFYEPGSEVHRIAKRFVELVREHEPTSGVA